MGLGFKIQFLNIFESYFKGKVEHNGTEFTINVQSERRGKVLKLPIPIDSHKERVLVRFTGPRDIYVEDFLPFKGESEWLEIDSDEITFFLADHQDQLDTIEVITDFEELS